MFSHLAIHLAVFIKRLNTNVGDFGSKTEYFSCTNVNLSIYIHTSMLSHANRHKHMHSVLSHLLNAHTHTLTHTHPQWHNFTLCYHTQKHVYKNQFDYKKSWKLKCMARDLCCHIKMARGPTKWSWDETWNEVWEEVSRGSNLFKGEEMGSHSRGTTQ